MPPLYSSPLAKEVATFYSVHPHMTISDVARHFNIPISAARKALIALGVYTPKPRLTDKQRRDIADEYMQGNVSLKELSERYSCSETTIHTSIIEFYGPNYRGGRTKVSRKHDATELRIQQAVSLHHAGKSAGEIASQLGITETIVINYLKSNGLPVANCDICGSPMDTRVKKYCCKECYLLASRLRSHNLDIDDYTNLKNTNGGTCAICGGSTALVIDHNHKTGTIRGLLCNSCNVAIGLMEDDVNRLQRAIDYLSV